MAVKHRYELGNCLRGYHWGDFETDDEAWAELSARFDKSFPSIGGREVELKKRVRLDITSGGSAAARKAETPKGENDDA